MDLMKTLLIYMALVVSSATEASPDVTPFTPASLPSPTAYVTAVPTLVPTAVPTLVPTAVPTLVPTPSPTPAVYTTLYTGDRGDAVLRLQQRLKDLGYLRGSVDGIYGKQTRQAVEDFQQEHNLQVDGIAGPATQRVLFESTVPAATATARSVTPG